MKADVVPKQAPTVAFQQVWVFTTAVMNTLQDKLPAALYTLLQGLSGNAYVTQADLESDLQAATIDSQYWSTIEQAASASGMVLTQDLEFTLTILNNATPQPNIVFDLARTDILQSLGLGELWLLDNSKNSDKMPARYRVQTVLGQLAVQLAVFDDVAGGAMLFALPISDISLLDGKVAPQALVDAFAATGKYTLAPNAPIIARAQTLQFKDFVHVSYAATFKSSTVPGFPTGDDFGTTIWPVSSEPSYDEALTAVGNTGAPLPIMSGFHFLFEDASLSIQEGYVSILAQVSYKSQ